MWLLSYVENGNSVTKLFNSLEETYTFAYQYKRFSAQFIEVYTKPEKAESKEDYKPLVPLSRAK